MCYRNLVRKFYRLNIIADKEPLNCAEDASKHHLCERRNGKTRLQRNNVAFKLD